MSYSADQHRLTVFQEEAKAMVQARREAAAEKAAQRRAVHKGKGKARGSTPVDPRSGSKVQGSSRQSTHVEPRGGKERGAVKGKSRFGQIRRPKDTDTEVESEEDTRQSKDDEPRVGATTTSPPTQLAQTRQSTPVEQRVTAPTDNFDSPSDVNAGILSDIQPPPLTPTSEDNGDQQSQQSSDLKGKAPDLTQPRTPSPPCMYHLCSLSLFTHFIAAPIISPSLAQGITLQYDCNISHSTYYLM
jgi:hypothetical protein